MKKYKRCLGGASIALGSALIMALVLPSDFWFFMVGLLLIICGICACRRR